MRGGHSVSRGHQWIKRGQKFSWGHYMSFCKNKEVNTLRPILKAFHVSLFHFLNTRNPARPHRLCRLFSSNFSRGNEAPSLHLDDLGNSRNNRERHIISQWMRLVNTRPNDDGHTQYNACYYSPLLW